jgi:hypothetical protein
MKPIIDSSTLVIVGKWNKYILSPNWVANTIFEEATLNVDFPLRLDLPSKYTSPTSNITFIPSEDRVIFIPPNFEESTLTKIEKMSHTLLTHLSYTPIIAFGINICFVEKDNAALYALFNISDNDKLSESGFQISTNSVVRNLKSDNGQILNFKITQKANEITFEFNFHYPVKNATEAREKLEEGIILKNKGIALELLEGKYDLQLDAETAGGQ